MTDLPLIHTTKGNILVSLLTHQVEWIISDKQIVFVEIYLLDGEVVKQSSHIRVLEGVSMSGTSSI